MDTNQTNGDLKLSILDIATMYNGESAMQTLQNSMELVQLADRLGFARYHFGHETNIMRGGFI